jgi:hypothetical protein
MAAVLWSWAGESGQPPLSYLPVAAEEKIKGRMRQREEEGGRRRGVCGRDALREAHRDDESI